MLFNRLIPSGIARDMYPVTPSNTLQNKGYSIQCKGNAGNVVLVTLTGETRTIPIAAGETINVGFVRVNATNTTATGLWAYIL